MNIPYYEVLAFTSRVLKGRDYFAVFESEKEVAAIQPDFAVIAGLVAQGVIITGPWEKSDFVSRYFVPGAGIPEDPVTGSTHCVLIPYWSKRLGKRKMRARQISPGEGVTCGARIGEHASGSVGMLSPIWTAHCTSTCPDVCQDFGGKGACSLNRATAAVRPWFY